jgi:hypothetical protein
MGPIDWGDGFKAAEGGVFPVESAMASSFERRDRETRAEII